MDALELFLAEVVLLSPQEGGRGKPLSTNAYDGRFRLHLVLESRANRTADVGLQQVMDRYVEVAFWDGPDSLPIGSPAELTLALIYAPDDLNSSLVPGATFTLREGPIIIGHGVVRKRWQEPTE